MQNAFNVASYIIYLAGTTGEPVTNIKLQKLLYYSYAWVLVETNNQVELFPEPIQAWPYGPVVPAVYKKYKKYGADNIKEAEGGVEFVQNEDQKIIIQDVFKIYGAKSALQLVELSHCEPPWRDVYKEGQKEIVIPRQAIFDYFSSIKPQAI